jgi:RNA polymerase sigma-70 factor, ECF subfamily
MGRALVAATCGKGASVGRWAGLAQGVVSFQSAGCRGWMKPVRASVRPTGYMDCATGALPLAGFGVRVAANPRVDYENTPEGAIVRRAQAGDESAFAEIVDRYDAKVFSIIHGIVRHRNDVEDIAQQVFAKVYVSIRNFDFRSSLITWIYKITVNECFDYLRKRRVRKLVYESDLSEDEVRRVENSEPAFRREPPADLSLARRDYVVKLLTRVSEEERTLLIMKEVEGYSVDELARSMGMNENTVKVKLFRARQKLVKAAQKLDRMPGAATA